jgi:hypothetical protein
MNTRVFGQTHYEMPVHISSLFETSLQRQCIPLNAPANLTTSMILMIMRPLHLAHSHFYGVKKTVITRNHLRCFEFHPKPEESGILGWTRLR